MSVVPSGAWIVATTLLGRLVTENAAEEYPHVCTFRGLWRRDCAACSYDQQEHAALTTAQPARDGGIE